LKIVAFGHHAQNDRWAIEIVFPALTGDFFVEAGACGDHLLMRFPEKGKNPGEIRRALDDMSSDDADWRAGRTWSLVYSAGLSTMQSSRAPP